MKLAGSVFVCSFFLRAETAPIHGLNMYYEIHGDGPPVVLLHGGTASIRSSFSNQIDVLVKAGHRVIGIEQMAHGHTADIAVRPLTYESMTEDTAALLSHLGIRNASLIGWSDGGQIALRLAAEHPELVRRVAASGVGFGANPANRQSIETMGWDKWPPEFRSEYARISPDGIAHWPIFWRKLCKMWAGATWGFTAADLARITAPALIIAGDHDVTSVAETKRLAAGIPNSRVVILPNTGHFTFQTRAAELNPILLEFMANN
jgi:pimeloyl-ACP methyl ester carboxylesterase